MIRYLHKSNQTKNNKQIILFPFAGGYSNSFRQLSAFFPENWDIISFDPPGHGANSEPLIVNTDLMVEWYLQKIGPLLTENSILFGHSLGGLMAYLVASALKEEGRCIQKLVISSSATPNRHLTKDKLSELSDPELLEYIIKLGGIPEELIKQKVILEYILPVFRADFALLENTKPILPNTILDIPTILFSGESDIISPPNEVNKWRNLTKVEEHITYKGNHMYIINQPQDYFRLLFENKLSV